MFRKTQNMIKLLEQRERRGDVKEFLSSYMNKKGFYVYFSRAKDDALRSVVAALRSELRLMVRRKE